MSKNREPFADVIIPLVLTPAAYALIAAGLFVGLNFFSPVGIHTLFVFALVVIPAALLFVGWVQGRLMLAVHLMACMLIWGEAWRFAKNYVPDEHVGTLFKEQPVYGLSTAIGALVICAILATIRNVGLGIRGRTIELRWPLRRVRS